MEQLTPLTPDQLIWDVLIPQGISTLIYIIGMAIMIWQNHSAFQQILKCIDTKFKRFSDDSGE